MKLINEAQRFQKLAGVQGMDEGIGKKIAITLATIAALATGKVNAQSILNKDTTAKVQDVELDKEAKLLKAGAKLVEKYLRTPEPVREKWDKHLLKQLKKLTDRSHDIYNDDLINLGKEYGDIDPNTAKLEETVDEALASLREEETQETSEELTPEQIAVIKNIANLAEAAEGGDDAKYEKLKSILDKLPKAMLTGAFVATLITSLPSCKTSGYGCRGRESWKGMIRRINRP